MTRKLFLRRMRLNSRREFYHVQVIDVYAAERREIGTVLVADTLYGWRTKRGIAQPWEDGALLLVAPDEYIDPLEAIDKQIKSLRETRQNLVEEAARRARPAKLSDVEATQ